METRNSDVSRRSTRNHPNLFTGSGQSAEPDFKSETESTTFSSSEANGCGNTGGNAGTDEAHPSGSWGHTRTFSVLKCVLCVACGIIFGFAMEKGRIFEPRYIRNQMVLSRFVMLKMFLSAVATGMFGMSMLAMIPGTHHHFMRCSAHYYQGLADKGVLSSLVGGATLGIGMVIAGSCPTSIFSQLGAMLPNAGYTLAGGLVASLLYALLKSRIDSYLHPVITDSSNPWENPPYFVLSLPVVAMFGILVCAFEILIPWTSDVKMRDPEGTPMLNQKAWPPYYSGVLIGALQVPLLLGLGESLGGSSSLLTLVSQIFIGPIKKLSPFICKYRTSFGSWWQVFYVSGVMMGSYISGSMSGTLGHSKGVPITEAFLGGFIIILGARIAGGCTSGHGLSGMGFLSILSFITVSAMFMGAIPTAFIMQSRGALQLT